MGRNTPRIRSDRDLVRVAHVESSSSLTVAGEASFAALQCIPSTFTQWLSGVAINWGKWRWKRLEIIYMPVCPTSTSGSIHMGFLYDSTDSTPSSVGQMSSLQGYTTGPVWGGSEGAKALSGGAIPPGAISVRLDVSRTAEKWFPYVSSTELATELAVSSALGNTRVPAQLVVATADGPSTSVTAGRLYTRYEIELIEPKASALEP